jgi:hypothetical protein
MTRSTRAEKIQHLNTAFELLARGYTLAQAASALSEESGSSLRQAYRYVHAARGIKRPAPVSAPTIPITIKVREDIVAQLRAHARDSGLTIGEVVARAVVRWLARERRRG